MFRLPKEEFYQFIWRPRPPSRLSKDQEEDILRNLKKYSKKYDEEDAQIMNAVSPCYSCKGPSLLDSQQNGLCRIREGMTLITKADLQVGSLKRLSSNLNLYPNVQADTEIIAERSRLQEDWKVWLAAKAEWLEWIETGRTKLLGDKLKDLEGEYTVQEVEAEVPMGPPQEEIIKF